MTVTDEPTGEKLYTAADLLSIVLAAYERGLIEGGADLTRDRWRDSSTCDAFRSARMRTEVASMKRLSAQRYERAGYPAGYDYRGGAVDWDTGMPAGSACAWLRRQAIYALAAGE